MVENAHLNLKHPSSSITTHLNQLAVGGVAPYSYILLWEDLISRCRIYSLNTPPQVRRNFEPNTWTNYIGWVWTRFQLSKTNMNMDSIKCGFSKIHRIRIDEQHCGTSPSPIHFLLYISSPNSSFFLIIYLVKM